MGVFSKRKNKRYDYTPRYYKGEGNPYEIKHKFDDFRSTVGNTNGFKSKINTAWDDYKNNVNENANKRVLIIIGILIFVFLLIIGFDLSIFFSKK
ncbi:riboflavin synthase subunit beta [Bizionia myxarmorum]|uniref:Riboflavin synthase subunit beta n=1 Tax=Bizionia myxarmorum TaxID=291186 RepID=A0A5D0R800_9FLAO|nr:riboflavin synthase subunit beta [Bizionia myxarmorum]TYB77055.1 riboflavin synthase subunit beta [Bizionia myxarmorum]